MRLVLEEQREKCLGSIERELIFIEIGGDFIKEMLISLSLEQKFLILGVDQNNQRIKKRERKEKKNYVQVGFTIKVLVLLI